MIDRTVANELAQQIKELKKELKTAVKGKGVGPILKKAKFEENVVDAMLKEIAKNAKKSDRFSRLSHATITKISKEYIDNTAKQTKKMSLSIQKNIDEMKGFVKGEISQILGEAEGLVKFAKNILMIAVKPFLNFSWNFLLKPLGGWIKKKLWKTTDAELKDGRKATGKVGRTMASIRAMFGDLTRFMKKMFSSMKNLFDGGYQKRISNRLMGGPGGVGGPGGDDDDEGGGGNNYFGWFSKGRKVGRGGRLGKLGKYGKLAKAAKWGAGLGFLVDAGLGYMDEGVKGAAKGAVAGDRQGGVLNAATNAWKWSTAGAVAGGLIGTFLGPGVGTVIGAKVGAMAGAGLGGILGWIGGDGVEQGISDAGSFIKDMFGSIKTFFSASIDKVKDWWEVISPYIVELGGKIKDTVTTHYEGLKTVYGDLYTNTTKFFKDLTETSEKDWAIKVKDSAEELYNTIIGLMKGATERFVPGGGMLTGAVSIGANAIGNAIFGNPQAGLNTGNTLVQNPGGSAGAIPQQYVDLIQKSAAASGFSPALIAGLIKQESNWNPNAVSPKGARGLGQFMPGTASALNIDPSNPEQSIMGIGRYLKDVKETLMRKGIANPSTEQILAGYNAGPGNVLKYGGAIPPFAETQKYVPAVLRNAAQYGGTGSGGLSGIVQNMANGATGSFVNSLQQSVNSIIQSGTQYVRGGKTLQGLDCSGATDFIMNSSLSQFNSAMADAYKKSVAGAAAGKAGRISQTFGTPLVGPDQLNADILKQMGAGTVLSWDNQDKKKWYTGHNATVGIDPKTGQPAVIEMGGGREGTGGRGDFKITPIDEWMERNKGKYSASNPLMAAGVAGMASPAAAIQASTLRQIEQKAEAQFSIIDELAKLAEVKTAQTNALTNIAQVVNNSNKGSNMTTRQVTSPPANIMEGQFSLFALNSTYNE